MTTTPTTRKLDTRDLLVYALALVFALFYLGNMTNPTADTEDEGTDTASVNENAEEQEEAASEEKIEYSDLVVHFLDVGQGDCAFVELPDGKTLLLDTGKPKYSSEVINYIGELGYTSVDYAIASNMKTEHVGGLPDVIEQVEIGEIWAPDTCEDTDAYVELLKAANEKSLNVGFASAGTEIAADDDAGYSVIVLTIGNGKSDGEEDDSIVLRVEYGETSFLFTSDATKGNIVSCQTEEVDVLQVALHGGKKGTGQKLSETLSPECAVISYAKNNTLGTPDQTVLDALEQVDAEIYGTAANGTVVVSSDGSDIDVAADDDNEVTAGVSAKEKAAQQAAQAQEQAEKEAAAEAAAAAESEEKTVYVTETGSKYHSTESCSGLSNANSVSEVSLSTAESWGLEPCSICY